MTWKSYVKTLTVIFRFLPNGVNTEKFKPFNQDLKDELRKKYNIPHDSYVILHVGNIRKDRNLSVFKKLKQEDIEVVIVSSGTITKDETHITS